MGRLAVHPPHEQPRAADERRDAVRGRHDGARALAAEPAGRPVGAAIAIFGFIAASGLLFRILEPPFSAAGGESTQVGSVAIELGGWPALASAVLVRLEARTVSGGEARHGRWEVDSSYSRCGAVRGAGIDGGLRSGDGASCPRRARGALRERRDLDVPPLAQPVRAGGGGGERTSPLEPRACR